jgi:hypothetical protein
LTALSSISKLALVGGASAQAMVNLRIQLVGNQLTAQLNKRIAQLKAQSNDVMIPVLQSREQALTKQQSGYSAAQGVLSQNGVTLSDLTLQLGNLAAAAQAGDAGTFDFTLQAATSDVANLALVAFQTGFQPDGVLPLKGNGLGIQSSAAYDLSTAAGKARAAADVQAALVVAQRIFTQTAQNKEIAGAANDALDGQISAISDQISQLQFKELSNASTEIAKLKQQTQQRFHLIELAFGSVGQSASVLTSVQNTNNIAPPPGSIISLLVGPSSTLSLAVGNLTTASLPGSTVSTTA